jgi:hypothetical protein
LTRRAGTPTTVDPTIIVRVLPLTPNEAQLVARAVKQLMATEGESGAGRDVLAMLKRPLETRLFDNS